MDKDSNKNLGTYVYMFRKMTNWRWYDNPNAKVVFLHCLLTANWKGKEWHDIWIPRGSLVTSYQNLATMLGLTKQQVRTAIDKLCSGSSPELNRKITRKRLLLSVCNFDTYNPKKINNNTMITAKEHDDNSKITPTKEYKEDKNKEKINKKENENYTFLKNQYGEFESIWNEWVAFRSEIKKKLTTRSANKQLKDLREWSEKGINPIETINNSIRNSWQGLFKPKTNNSYTAGNPQSLSEDDSIFDEFE